MLLYLVFCVGLHNITVEDEADGFNNRPFAGSDEIFKHFLNLHSSAVGMEPRPINTEPD